MNIWRLDIFVFADLMVTALLVVLLSVALWLRRRAHGEVTRGVIAGLALGMLLVSPALVGAMTEPHIVAARMHGLYVDPSWLVYWLPAMASGALVALAILLFPMRTARVLFCCVALIYAGSNFANLCTPGWCGRYGFPFAYYTWSDALSFDGKADPFNPVAALANAVLFAIATAVVAISYRRVPR